MTQEQISTYKAALKEARTAFDKAWRRKSEAEMEAYKLGKEMALLRRTITALAAMCSEDPKIDALGITEACMDVMSEMEHSLTTNQVVGFLETMGFDIEAQKNAAASVHAVLSRLANKGKIMKIEDAERGVIWRGPKLDPELDALLNKKEGS